MRGGVDYELVTTENAKEMQQRKTHRKLESGKGNTNFLILLFAMA